MSSASKHSRRSPTRPQTRTGTMTSSSERPMTRAGTMTTTTSSEERPTTVAAAAAADLSIGKQRHYPPASGGNTASRNRVLSLFRRSGSHEVASTAQPAQTAAQPAQTAEQPAEVAASTTTGSIGIPSRVRGDDELTGNNSLGLSLGAGVGASATPPPIMRNPRNSARGSVDSGLVQVPTSENAREVAAETKDVVEVQATPQEATATAPAVAPGQRMKWLGRVTSLRNRTG